MLIEKCPEDKPLMIQAWVDCLRWAMKQTEIIQAFTRDTGISSIAPKTAIEQLIDDSTGSDEAKAMAFVDWFNNNVWGAKEENAPEATNAPA